MKFIPQEMPEKGSTVVVGLSGGVDSTLTALLLKEKGCNVIGVTMSLWDGHLKAAAEKVFHGSCYGPDESEDFEECSRFCSQYDIPYHVIDVSQDYNNQVLEYFKDQYRSGLTPNPCIRCNRFVKFGALLEGVKKLGIEYDYFCTGHYAMIVRPDQGLFGSDIKPCMIATALDESKDQSYFLCRVPSQVLEKVRFPLALIKKTEVFELAKRAGLEAASRKESQDFIGSEYFDQLFADKPSVPGDIVDVSGKVLGKHKGIEYYTIGQRRGLGVSSPKPLYVYKIDAENNQIVLAEKEYLASSSLLANDFVWPGNIAPKESFECFAKIRLASKISPCLVEKVDMDTWKVTFENQQNAVTPGQSLVLYKNNVVIGAGIILK
ncbi:MAG: tRNA 2-thiouridine(34) synthase MnmA [Treponemataceae bacterium]|nr:tRNA 2-thiouridine(34) synthase MnmA [Treponemataceae bacterium]